jgi:mRNA interferase YafQ
MISCARSFHDTADHSFRGVCSDGATLSEKASQETDAIRATLQLLSEDAFHPSLKTHKLKGELAGSWACSAGYDCRIVFEFVTQAGTEAILLQSIGTHDEVY